MNTEADNPEPERIEDGSDARLPQEKAKPGRKKRIIVGVAAVALIASGTAVGTILPDPRASDVYLELAVAKTAVESERDTARSSYESMKSKYDELQKSITTREEKAQSRETAVGQTEERVKAAEAAVKQREEAVTGAERQKAANTVADGTWTVGSDIEPGTYRAAAAVGSTCYWGVYRSGSNGGDIIENDIPGGGRPVVTLSAGQDFNSTRCGKWEKQ